jgi:hypothetical protein
MRLSEPLADSRPRLRYPRGDPREPRTHAGTHAHFEGERRVPTESAGLGGYRLSEQIRECWRARQDSNLWPSAPEADLRELTTASSSWLMPIFIGCFGVLNRLIKTRLGSRVCMECVYGRAFRRLPRQRGTVATADALLDGAIRRFQACSFNHSDISPRL